MKLHNKSGTLTNYGFSCGYVERTVFNNRSIDFIPEPQEHIDIEIRLEKPCPGNYQFDVIVNNWRLGNPRIFWECYDNLTEARKVYNKLCRKYQKQYESLPK